MPDISIDRIKSIKTFPSLVVFLRDELSWPIEQSSFDELDEISFQYSTEELGLQEKFASKIRDIRQLRPVPGQPWGVFWVDFEPKHMPIGALRKILNYFVHKKRTRTGDRATWAMDDLLFIAGTGESGHRGTTFAHFHKSDDGGEELKEFSWDEAETHFHYILDYLGSLKWPEGIDQNEWREQWRGAFRGSTRKAIKTAEHLAVYMAELARDMRKRVNEAFEVESEKGPLHAMLNTFKKTLIHDLEQDAFADMYAQTVTYGLFSARCMDTDGHFELHEVIDRVPDTNPFLKGLFQECFKAAKKSKDNLNFDELGINRLVELLDDLNQKDGSDRMQEILREFGRQTRGEDPVIHFYEGFLNEYESVQRKRRGVYYTPDPVVSYIVRSVDEILRNEFGLELGLADTSTWGDLIAKGTLARPDGMHQSSKAWKELSNQPFVQILDPATGTGTFLKHTVLLIYTTMSSKWKAERNSAERVKELWNDYVPTHLLPRIYGFEIMMAPYSVCHMKLGLVLKETGYDFKGQHRLQVYLTNALEPPHSESGLPLFDSYIADEVKNANVAKNMKRFTVIIGNPPYSNFGQLNKNQYILNLLGDYKRGLEEKKLNITDDFIKFVRFAQCTIDATHAGVVGMITNNVYIDGLTHRRMRQSLLESFQLCFIMDLHGSVKKQDTGPDGSKDENVFDIQQGVAISLWGKIPNKKTAIRHCSLRGAREAKYAALLSGSISSSEWKPVEAKPPQFLLCPSRLSQDSEYLSWTGLKELFEIGAGGLESMNDLLAVSFTKTHIMKTVSDLREMTPQKFRAAYTVADSAGWKLESALKDVRAAKKPEGFLRQINYRPFDVRWTFYSGNQGFLSRPRFDLFRHLINSNNVGLCAMRQSRAGEEPAVFVIRGLAGKDVVSLLDRGTVFPLFLENIPTQQADLISAEKRAANFSNIFIKRLNETFHQKTATPELPCGITPEGVFRYAYAVFHSPAYRLRYADFLKIDFPRLPLSSNLDLFQVLAKLGGELVALHLLESPKVEKYITKYLGDNSTEIEKISWVGETVWIDKEQSVGFQGVPECVWSFCVGGYQVCERWLKDRRGRKLSKDDIDHYQKIVVALSETIRIMSEIDKVIDQHGGWPGAFK